MAAMARWCFQRRAWVLIGWLALLAVLGVTGRAAGSTYSDALTLPGTGSTTAQNLLEQAFPGHAGDQETIVWRASSGSVSAATGDNHQAVRTGQATTGRVIAAAATIMILVFSAFILSGQQAIGEIGFGMAAAVLLDAFLLRTLLVPALMHLSGRANWWLPGWLDCILPHLSIEPATQPPALPAPGSELTRSTTAG